MPVFRAGGRLHVYVHVPKCAGRSVESYLESRFGSLAFLDNRYYKVPRPDRWTKCSPQHVEAAAFDRLFPDDWIASRFAIVRHPLTRFTSSYNYYLANLKRTPLLMSPEDWFREYRALAPKAPHYLDNHLRLQTEMVPASATVFKLEHGMAPVVAHLDDLAGTADGPREITHDHATVDDERMSKVPLSRDLLRQLQDFYGPDFERFDYDPNETDRALVFAPTAAEWPVGQRLVQMRRRLKRRLWGVGVRLRGEAIT